jgi:hypothetical protein
LPEGTAITCPSPSWPSRPEAAILAMLKNKD